MSAPAPLLLPFGAMEKTMLKLQEEWWDFRPTDPRMEQSFLKHARGPFLEPPQITSHRCHLHLASPNKRAVPLESSSLAQSVPPQRPASS